MNKPISILATDLHYSRDSVEEVNLVLDQLISKTLEIGLDTIFILGDVFTDRIGQNLEVLLGFDAFLQKCKHYSITIIMIAGNHDKTNQKSLKSYLDIFNKDNIYIVRDFQCIINGNVSYSLLPYFKEGKCYNEKLDRLIEENRDTYIKCTHNYLLTHVAINGVRNNDGSIVDSGVKSSKFSIFSKVFVGHYHNASKVGNNIFYISSIMPRNYGEDNDKGFTILYDDGTHKLFNPKFKKYKKVVIDLDTTKKTDVLKLRNKYKDSKNNIRFVLKGTEEQLMSMDNGFFSRVGIEVKKESKNILKSVEAAKNGESTTFDKKNIMSFFKEYCELNKFEPKVKGTGFKYLVKI